MIEVTNLDFSFISKQSGKEMRVSHDPTAFAKKMEDASNRETNKRENTFETAKERNKVEGRKGSAQEVSTADNRTDQAKKASRNVEASNDNPDQTEQNEAMESGHSLLMWFHNMPEELVDLTAVSLEGDISISEDSMKNILLWMQSLTEVDMLPEELKALAEKLTASLQNQIGMVPPGLTTEQNTKLTTFLSQLNSLMNAFSVDTTESKYAQQDVIKQSSFVAEVISENVPADTAKMRDSTSKQEVDFLKGIITVEGQESKNVTPILSEDQSKGNEFVFQEKHDAINTNEQPKETVIPFSLAQIETLLQQNTVTNVLNQEQTQLHQNVHQQIADKIQLIHGTNQSFVTLQLSPEHLGKLTIQLVSDMQQGMTAKIYAETPHAKEMIESNFGQLKDALSGKGVNLTAMEVFVGQDPESSEKQREFHYQQARAQRRKGSRIASLSNTGKTSLISEIPVANNPYFLSEGFNQLG